MNTKKLVSIRKSLERVREYEYFLSYLIRHDFYIELRSISKINSSPIFLGKDEDKQNNDYVTGDKAIQHGHSNKGKDNTNDQSIKIELPKGGIVQIIAMPNDTIACNIKCFVVRISILKLNSNIFKL